MQARRNWRARWLVSVLSTTLVAGAIVGTESPAAAFAPEVALGVSVSGGTVPVTQRSADKAAGSAVTRIAAPSWQASSWSTASDSARAQVEVLDREAAAKAGINGQIIRLSRTDRVLSQAKMTLNSDYSAFRNAFGGDYASRMSIVKLPECALSTPELAHCRPTPVPARNDVKAGKIAAEVMVEPGNVRRSGLMPGIEPQTASTSSLFAVTAASGGSSGDFKASSLAPSATWSVGLQSGEFGWTYPIDTPDMPGGAPDVALSYSSGGTDGRTAATNNQVSWMGEGFSYQPGFIERHYKPCAEDGHPGKGDECWASHNAVLSLNGNSELVRDDVTGVWRSEADDSYKVELLTGASNGDNDGEHWVITGIDGTQYHFGTRPAANSTWTMPVFGDDAGEPCAAGTFDASWCQQAYRWSLDYVVDRHGDVIAYFYDTETNNYGRNGSPSAATPYVRSGRISRIEYGMRADQPGATATARVQFLAADRCLPGSDCSLSQPQNFPDTPLDLQCDGSTCGQSSPAFFTTKRLSRIVTQVLVGGTYQDVDSWTFNHLFPATGDGTSPTLWLESIVRTGHVGGTLTMPEINFDGVQLRNRVADGSYAAMWKWRVNKIINETGGQTELTYGGTQCAVATPETNDQRCFPAYWTPEGQSNPVLEYFHKYVVTEVRDVDLVAGNPARVTQYEYVGGPAWHYDDAELLTESRKTYGNLRGFQTVRVRTGNGTDGPQTMTEHLFLRGMHDDKLPDGSRRNVQITDSRGGSITDSPQLRGFARETRVFNGVGGAWVSTTVSEPWMLGPTARRMRSAGPLESYMTNLKVSRSWTALADGGVNQTEEQATFDNFGRIVQINDLDDVSTPDDDSCTRHWYTENQALWILETTKRVEEVSVACTVTPSDADVLSERRMYYDGSNDLDAAPTVGNITKGETLAEINAGVRSYAPAGRIVFDVHGRVVEDYDPSGDRTVTAYTPAVGGPLTIVTKTNPLGFTSVTSLDPRGGDELSQVDPNGRMTEFSYDPMGRLLAGWLPGRAKATQTPSATFEYLLRNNAPSVVTTKTLQGNGSYTGAYTLLDGFLQERQTQGVSPAGGRIVADTFHDSHGRVARTNDAFHNTSAPGTTLMAAPADTSLNGYTKFVFDGAGRESNEISYTAGVEKARTITTYGGNWVATQPPAGGHATMERFNASGQKVELRQFHSVTPSGAYDQTRFTYTKRGQLSTVTEPSGAVWSHFYDLRGREIRTEEPDKGTTTSTYDDKDRLQTATDARGKTLSYVYDALDRQTGLYEGSTQLAKWEFDTLPGGKLLPVASTRFVGGNAYRNEVLGYDSVTGRLTGTAMVVPASEGALAGRYESLIGYNQIGQITSTTQPAIGGLPAETITTAYNNLGMPTGLNSALTTYGALSYDNLNSINMMTLGASGKYIYQSLLWDKGTRQLSRAIISRQGISPNVVADYNYTHDAFGNITKIANTPASQLALSDVQCFQYDYLQRLTEAWTASDNCAGAPAQSLVVGAAPYWHSYSYDVAGSRQSEVQHSSAGDTMRTYHNTGHKLDSVQQGTRTDTFTYDSVGNMTTRNVNGVNQNLTWDAEGHVDSIAQGGQTTSYVYDAEGNRIIRKEPQGTTLYIGTMEVRLSGTVVTGTRYYTLGGDQIAVRVGNEVTWTVGDHQETTGLEIKAADLTQVNRRYTLPFGGKRGVAPGSWVGEKGFVGGTIDASVGLTHLGAREFDTATARFISVDPVVDLDNPQQMHGYSYSDNSPISKSDPDGKLWGWVENAFKKVAEGYKWAKDSGAWDFAKSALSVVGPVCPVCAGVAAGMSVIDAVVAIHKGDGLGAVIEIASVVTFGAGKAAGAIAKGAEKLNKTLAAKSKAIQTAKGNGVIPTTQRWGLWQASKPVNAAKRGAEAAEKHLEKVEYGLNKIHNIKNVSKKLQQEAENERAREIQKQQWAAKIAAMTKAWKAEQAEKKAAEAKRQAGAKRAAEIQKQQWAAKIKAMEKAYKAEQARKRAEAKARADAERRRRLKNNLR